MIVSRERFGDEVVETEITMASQWDLLPTSVQWIFLVICLFTLGGLLFCLYYTGVHK